MIFWFILLGILGFFTYITVQRRVASITRTPVWLLWLVMMMPAFIWTGWLLWMGEDSQIPLLLLVGPFLLCPVLYWGLIQWGRPRSPNPPPLSTDAPQSPEASEKTAPTPPGAEAQMPLKPINREEEATLQTCFPWSVYYLQNVEYRPQALICRGQLRASPEVAYQTIRENIERNFGDRFLVIFQEGLNGKPFFALVPNAQRFRSKASNLGNVPLAVGLFVLTLISTTVSGVVLTGLEPEEWPGGLEFVGLGLPYGVGLMAILGMHELAHYFTARRYDIRVTLPYFIPILPTAIFPFGTFGAFIQMRSPIPNRKALFDVGIAGPLIGFAVTLPVLLWGLAQSTPVERSEMTSLLNFNNFDPQSSVMLAVFSRLVLGSQLSLEQGLDLHPVAIAGCIGIVITALNLMPVGQLDGGHIVHAMFGQRMGANIGQISRLLVLVLSFVQQEYLLWAILLLFIPAMDEPALNDVSELDNRRDLLGLLTLLLLILIVVPAPPALSRFLF